MFHDEDSFQAHLDEHPDDYFARGVFADWLEEQGDVRAEGYRAMLACGLHGSNGRGNELLPDMPTCWFKADADLCIPYTEVPNDWYDLLRNNYRHCSWYTNDYPNRRSAEDALARAFSLLPEDRRRELLSGKRNPSVGVTTAASTAASS